MARSCGSPDHQCMGHVQEGKATTLHITEGIRCHGASLVDPRSSLVTLLLSLLGYLIRTSAIAISYLILYSIA